MTRDRLAVLLLGIVVGAVSVWVILGRVAYFERVSDYDGCKGVNGYVGADANLRQVWLCTEDGKLHTLSR